MKPELPLSTEDHVSAIKTAAIAAGVDPTLAVARLAPTAATGWVDGQPVSYFKAPGTAHFDTAAGAVESLLKTPPPAPARDPNATLSAAQVARLSPEEYRKWRNAQHAQGRAGHTVRKG